MARTIDVSGIGKRLRKYRVENGDSANSLAMKLKDMFGQGSPSRQMITNLETGQKKDVTVTELLQFAQGLGISPVALICDIEQPEDPSDNETTHGAKNKDVCDWFNINRFRPYIFEEDGSITFAETPAANRLRSIASDLRALKDARKKSKDSYDLFKRVVRNKEITDPAIADWLKQDSTNNNEVANILTAELKKRGMRLPE